MISRTQLYRQDMECTHCSRRSPKHSSMKRWKLVGEFVSPNGIPTHSYSPHGVTKAVSGWLSGTLVQGTEPRVASEVVQRFLYSGDCMDSGLELFSYSVLFCPHIISYFHPSFSRRQHYWNRVIWISG